MILLKKLNEKMKKVLFFMFLLFLCLGTASVKAQVRIGGNTAPNASAVLDLNANDTNNGTKGLALPRVGLTSNTMLLPGVTTNLTGMLVYNTTTTGGAGVNTIGIYFWNGATWVKASLPSTSAADSGKVLMSNGTTPIWSSPQKVGITSDTFMVRYDGRTVTWHLVTDTSIYVNITPYTFLHVPAPGIIYTDVCKIDNSSFVVVNAGSANLRIASAVSAPASGNIRIQCYRPTY